MKINMPDDVKYILNRLRESGYEAYAVGGCVRDSILERKPDDWDITTSAKPEQIKEIFPKTIDTGIAHGTVTVMCHHVGYEVTTYRIDGEYEDSRHPKEVIFTSDLLEDLKRRDFTINAMAYNDTEGLIDAFGGMEDINKKTIRCVGDPMCRFGEDALRMMRAVRFSAQLGYEIEEETKEAIRKMAENLKNISAERIQVELVKLLVSNHPDYLRTAYELGMTKVFFPEFDKAMETGQNNPHHRYSVGEHSLHTLTQVGNEKILRLALVLHDIGKPKVKQTSEDGVDHFHGHSTIGENISKEVLRRLRFDNDTISKVCKLVKYHDVKIPANPQNVRKTMVKVGPELFPYLLQVKRADMLAQSMYRREEKEEELKELTHIYETILQEKDCLSLKDMAISGQDLIQLGMKPGKELGETLQMLFSYVLENPTDNKKETLIKYLNTCNKI